MSLAPRQRFLHYVRDWKGTRPVISPFLPHPSVVERSLQKLGLPISEDFIMDEVTLSRALGYEPMFMTDCPGLLFPWEVDEARSDEKYEVSTLQTSQGEWVRRVPREKGLFGDETSFPVRTIDDHAMLVAACDRVYERGKRLRAYFRRWRDRVGEDGVIVLGHPHPSWLGYQISQSNIFLHWADDEDVFRRSMDAIYEASLFIMSIALEEDIDFMSDSSYGLEMTSPALFEVMDLPYIQAYARWTHEQGGLFWYHNCGQTRRFILDGTFDRLGADVIETIAPPPAGDNADLAESRRHLDTRICSKGNLNLGLLRDGTPEQVAGAACQMVEDVQGYPHIFSTADAVLPGTPPENFITFITTLREAAG